MMFVCTLVRLNKRFVIVFRGLFLLIPAVYMRRVNIYICRVTINGEKWLGGATKLKMGMQGLINACEYVLWWSLVWSYEIWVNKHIVMRHSFWNVFHGSQAALRFWCLNIEAWGAASTELLQRAALLDPPLHLNVDGTILIAGCGSSAGQWGSTTRNNNGQAASMTWDWVEKNDFIQGKQISRRSFKTNGALLTAEGWYPNAGVIRGQINLRKRTRKTNYTARNCDRGDSSGWK